MGHLANYEVQDLTKGLEGKSQWICIDHTQIGAQSSSDEQNYVKHTDYFINMKMYMKNKTDNGK